MSQPAAPQTSTSAFLHSLGQKLKWVCLIGVSASPSKTDMRRLHRHVGFVAKADLSLRFGILLRLGLFVVGNANRLEVVGCIKLGATAAPG
jgi:hypothetical protein